MTFRIDETVKGTKCTFVRPFGNGAKEDGILQAVIFCGYAVAGFRVTDETGRDFVTMQPENVKY